MKYNEDYCYSYTQSPSIYNQDEFKDLIPMSYQQTYREKPLSQSILRESNATTPLSAYTSVDNPTESPSKNKDQFIIDDEIKKEDSNIEEYKILIIGNEGVGKRTIIKRFIFNIVNDDATPFIEEELIKNIKISEDKTVKLKITHSMAHKFSVIPKQFYNDVHAVLIVFDLTEQKSFSGLEKKVKGVRDIAPKDAIIFIIGNKNDLTGHRKFSLTEGILIAQKNNLSYFEVSAKTGNNIHMVFEELANKIYEIQKQNLGVERQKERKSIGLKECEKKKKVKSKCCGFK